MNKKATKVSVLRSSSNISIYEAVSWNHIYLTQ